MKHAWLKHACNVVKRNGWWVIFAIVSTTASAEEFHTGKVTTFHLNSDISGRGVCVQMDPPIPGSGWVCLSKTNALYKEITALLLTGHVSGKSCRIAWIPATIVWAECY